MDTYPCNSWISDFLSSAASYSQSTQIPPVRRMTREVEDIYDPLFEQLFATYWLSAMHCLLVLLLHCSLVSMPQCMTPMSVAPQGLSLPGSPMATLSGMFLSQQLLWPTQGSSWLPTTQSTTAAPMTLTLSVVPMAVTCHLEKAKVLVHIGWEQ